MSRALRYHGRTVHRRRSTAHHRSRTARPRPMVLIVDDDADARAIYGSYLRAMGCTVFTARDGAVGVEKATALSPDLIVMDLAMPEVDGWDATSQLRASKETERIPVLALSALQVSKEA